MSASQRRSAADRIERFMARALFRLPHGAQVWLSGKPPVVIDGLRLHPEIQLMLSARQRRRVRPLRGDSPQEARARMVAEAMRYASDPLETPRVRDLRIPTPAASLPARHYVTDEPGGPHPLLVFFHGGGFILGSIETHDELCRLLCLHAGVHVLSVEYRLAPEYPFPAAIEDGENAFRWALENAASLGADPRRVGVGGDSAGGNIATVTALLGGRVGRLPAFQLLLYPVVGRTATPSRQYFAKGFLLEGADIAWFDQFYADPGLSDERIAPLLAAELPDVPAIVVTAGFDPLRDEGEAYAVRLERQGTRVVRRRFASLIHGFASMTYVSPAAHTAVMETAKLLRQWARLPKRQ